MSAVIHYHDIGDYLSREEKLKIIDDKELYLIGASLKDLGKRCFGFTRMDASEIPGLKARM